jgi:hypothetical protein
MANDASFFALRDALRTLRDLLPQLGSEVLGSNTPPQVGSPRTC